MTIFNWTKDCYMHNSDGALKEYKKYFNKNLVPYKQNNEFVCSKHPDFVGKTVLIVGGGPSTNIVNWKNIKFGSVWTVNHFFKNEKLKKYKFDFVSFMPEVDLDDKELHEYLNKYKPIIGHEINSQWKKKARRNKLYRLPKVPQFFYYVRFFSRMGTVARLCVLAHFLGAKTIYHVGFDGPIPIFEGKHAFQEGKNKFSSVFNEYSRQEVLSAYRIQYREFLEYTKNMNIVNLGKQYEYNIENMI